MSQTGELPIPYLPLPTQRKVFLNVYNEYKVTHTMPSPINSIFLTVFNAFFEDVQSTLSERLVVQTFTKPSRFSKRSLLPYQKNPKEKGTSSELIPSWKTHYETNSFFKFKK